VSSREETQTTNKVAQKTNTQSGKEKMFEPVCIAEYVCCCLKLAPSLLIFPSCVVKRLTLAPKHRRSSSLLLNRHSWLKREETAKPKPKSQSLSKLSCREETLPHTQSGASQNRKCSKSLHAMLLVTQTPALVEGKRNDDVDSGGAHSRQS
jgi:hypothetical protein